MSANVNSDEMLSFDIKRSIILAEYIKCWGLPETRYIMAKSEDLSITMPIELYVFPGEDMDQVSRVATIGLSACTFNHGQSCNSELLMVLPYDVVDDEIEAISNYIFEISAHIINTLGRNLKPEEVISENLKNEIEAMPEGWPKALLFDEPRGEPNELNYFHIAMQHVKLAWVIPIFASEYDLIQNRGIEAFDAAVDEAAISLVEVRRGACI